MKKFNVQITYTGMIEETIEAESLEEAKEKYEARNVPVDGATNLNDIKSNIGIFHVEKVEPNEGMVDINIETMKPFEEADDD